jgi:hypothetical protein
MTTLSIRFHFTTFRATSWNHTVVTRFRYKFRNVIVPITLGKSAELHAVWIGGLSFLHDGIQVTHVGL